MNKAVEDQIKLLLPAIQVLALASHKTLGERHAELLKFDLSSWEFFMTVAGLQAATTALAMRVGEAEFERYVPLMNAEIERWDRMNGLRAWADCGAFVSRALVGDQLTGDERKAALSDSLGMWVLWNLYRRAPSYREVQLARAVGYLMLRSFAEWWD
ncbi:MAG: hypothetical protein HY822_11155 [Acidobacteria bacterium]|nr:hypothetical protein [Acidobacteriota bacterium]